MSVAQISARTVRGLESTDQITMTGSGKAKVIHRLPMEDFRKGVASPSATVRNGVAGFLFDADAETLHVQFCVPKNWDAESDINMVIFCVLNADETVGDDIDWETSVVSVADHEDVDVAGTQTPGVNHDIGSDNGAGTLHKVTITLDYDNGTCPISPDDNVTVTLSRTANVGGVGYVAGVIVLDICIEYQINKLGEAI